MNLKHIDKSTTGLSKDVDQLAAAIKRFTTIPAGKNFGGPRARTSTDANGRSFCAKDVFFSRRV